ncbi:MAG: TrkH family potassium uptake protein, partial [Pseudomonadota bacterium]
MVQLTPTGERPRHMPRAIQQLRPALYIASIFGVVMSIAMVIPALVDLADGQDTWSVFAVASGSVFCVSFLGTVALREKVPDFTPRFGFLVTAVLWISCAIVAAVPFWLSPLPMTPAAAFFEGMSGLTTTGATVLSELDSMQRSFLLWRSMLQWLGGIGIIAVGLFLFPFLRIGGMQVFRTESSDRSDKAMPRVASVTRALCAIYVVATGACALTYAALGMSFFDAVNHAMTTVATGGFSTHDRSFGFFEDSRILWAAVFFMIVGALPFVLYVELVFRGRITLWRDWQVRTFFAGVVAIVIALSLWLEYTRNIDFHDAITQSAFNVVSVVTTTGYSSDDYAVWGPFAFGVFFILTFIGGCSGSTTGGIKVYRFIIAFQALRRAFTRLVYPNA